jgi:tripartite-type tricarboxylate transporter receptor subunit TctC
VPGYDFTSPFGLVAPAKTAPATIARLNQEIVKLLRQPEVKQRVLDTGAEVVGSTPEEYGAVLRNELSTWGKVIREAGLAKQ